MNFDIINEKEELKLGNIISIFKLPKVNNEIALFSIGDYDGTEESLHVAYINTDSDGYDYLSEIDDEDVYKNAMIAVKDMMEVINKNEQ